jgi:hypothetical protein
MSSDPNCQKTANHSRTRWVLASLLACGALFLGSAQRASALGLSASKTCDTSSGAVGSFANCTFVVTNINNGVIAPTSDVIVDTVTEQSPVMTGTIQDLIAGGNCTFNSGGGTVTAGSTLAAGAQFTCTFQEQLVLPGGACDTNSSVLTDSADAEVHQPGCDPAVPPCDTAGAHGGVHITVNPVNCNDNNACTTDTCAPSANDANVPVCSNSTISCNDNNACTADSCDPMTGCANTPIACNPEDACHTAACDPVAGCVQTPIACNPKDACNTAACDPVAGCVQTPIACNPQDKCNTASCDPATGCVQTPIACNPQDACNTAACDPATGCVQTPISCDDNNSCTIDSCDPTTGCTHTPDPNCNLICRTPGFFGTHATVTQAILTQAGGSISVCGQTLNNTNVGSNQSTEEALCVAVKGNQNLQLARQLTALALNCTISGLGSNCANDPTLSTLFSTCNSACTGSSSKTVNSCISAIDCFNNGGVPQSDGSCGTSPNGSCHDRDLPSSLPSGSADSSKSCNAATQNSCTIFNASCP